ncbi:hypothetical protein GVAV_001393 [Gurleya vavrai]
MIILPDEQRAYNPKTYRHYHSKPFFDFKTHHISYKRNSKEPHNFFEECAIINQRPLKDSFFETFAFENFLYSKEGKKFISFNPYEYYEFYINEETKKIRFIKEQIFINTNDRLYAVTDKKIQCIDVEHLDFDINKTANKIFMLQKDKIKIVDGDEHEIKCLDHKKIIATNHPSEVLIATRYNCYLIDLRQKKIAKRIFRGASIIKNVIFTDQNVLITDKSAAHIVRNNTLDFFDSFKIEQQDKTFITNKELIVNRDDLFCYHDINNLNSFTQEKIYLDDYLGFAVNDDLYCFFSNNGVKCFHSEGWLEITQRLAKYKFKKTDTEFFEKTNKYEFDKVNFTYRKNADFYSPIYENIMAEINDKKSVKNTEEEKSQKVTKKITRDSGF